MGARREGVLRVAVSIFADDFIEKPWWWEAAEPAARAGELPDSAEAVIVGGGYAGLSAALTLRRLGITPVVIDAERIGWGASSRNGGMVSGGLKVASGALEATHGKEGARRLADAAAASFPFIEETIAREEIACDYIRCGRYVPAWTPKHYANLQAKADFVADVTGLPTRMVSRADQHTMLGSDLYHGGMAAAATGSIHPGKYARGLAAAAAKAGAVLVDGVRVRQTLPDGDGFRVITDRGEVRTRAVLVATNGYSFDKAKGSAMPWLARRLVPLASYIIATEELGEDVIERLFPGRRMISDTKRVLNYFRPSPDGKRVLWGGRASFRSQTATDAAPVLRAAMVACFPELEKVRITHAWCGNVAFTFDTLPHIGAEGGVHYAAGCQGSGVAMATWLGHRVALKMAGAANEPFALDGLNFPTRPFYQGDPSLVLPVIGEWYRLRDRLDRMAA